MLPATDQIADFSLNFAQMGRPPWTNHPSPTNSFSSRTPSPASISCRTISSLETRRSTPLDSEHLQTPIFVSSDLAGSDSATFTTYPKSSPTPLNQQIVYARVNAGSIQSQGPTASLVDKNELENLRLSTGVPRHMMDVFRANPFTPMDLSHATNTALDSSTAIDSIGCKNGDSLRAVSMAKRKLSKSPETVEPKRKGRTKRARIQSPSFVPFLATGPQEMYAYEFMVDVAPPSRNMGFSRVENKWSDRPSLSGLVDNHEHLPAAQSRVVYDSEDAYMRLPVDCGDAALSHPSRLSHPYSHNASFPARSNSSHHMHPSYLPFLPSAPLHTHMSPYFGASSNPLASASRLDNEESWSRFEERDCGSLPSVVPTQVMTENIHSRPPSATSLAASSRSPFYACPLCPRDFKLPNGLALHLKWHDRVSGSTSSLTRWQGLPRNRSAVKVTRTEFGQPRGLNLRSIQSYAQVYGQEYVNRLSYSSRPPLEGSNLVPVKTEQYADSLLFEYQPQDCALFHDALQSNERAGLPLESNTYLAPLDGLSVLQPLPFEQFRDELS